jgi:hypothetical protein
MENYKTNYSRDKEEKMALDWSYPKLTHREGGARLEPSGGSKGAAVPERPERWRSRKKPWMWGRQGARLKELLLRGSGGSVSQVPYAPEGAIEIIQIDRTTICINASFMTYAVRFLSV